MAKRYLVKTTGIATDMNVSFRGNVLIVYWGKDQMQLGREGTHAIARGTEEKMIPYFVEQYGYTRRCDAVRSWIYKNPQNDNWWKTRAEIIEVEV